jgi:hypothetical protein
VTSPENEWLEDFASRLGIEAPSEAERDTILALAGTAAHASQRTAAPIACWMAAAAGLSVDAALALAREVPPAASGDDVATEGETRQRGTNEASP